MNPHDHPKNHAQTEKRVNAMIEMGQSLTAVHNLDELLELIVTKVTEVIQADRSTIFLVDKKKQQIWSKVAQGENLTEIRLPIGQGLAGWVTQHGQSINLANAYADERFCPDVDKKTGYLTRNMLAVPLSGKQDDVLGVIQVLNKLSGHFDNHDEQLLEAIGSQISVAIENAQLMQNMIRKNIELKDAQQALAEKVEELDVLFKMEKKIARAMGSDEIVSRILRQAVDLMNCEAGSLLLSVEESDELVFVSAVGGSEKQVKYLRLPRGAGVAGWVAENKKTACVENPKSDPRHLATMEEKLQFPVANILAIPLPLGGGRTGALELLNKRKGAFAKDDIKLATLLAGQAAVAVQVSQKRDQHEKANRLASIGQMLSGIIHDLRTPMTIISGYAQLMALEDDPVQRQEHSDLMLRQFDFISDMTKELLAFARGDSSLLLKKVYPGNLLDDMQEVLIRELEGTGVLLQRMDNYTGALRLDETKFRRIIFNLVKNAHQAMPHGGMFSIRTEDDGEGVRFEFTDTGTGIPESIQGKLFESFVTSGKQEGTGLGLAVVKKIVDEHAGRIHVESKPGHGSTFSIWLPKRLARKQHNYK
jgi:signal transduction histidine kinase/DNA-binding protein